MKYRKYFSNETGKRVSLTRNLLFNIRDNFPLKWTVIVLMSVCAALLFEAHTRGLI